MSKDDLTRRGFMLNAGAGLLAASPLGAAVPLAPPDKQPPKLPVPPGESRKIGVAVVGLGQLALEEVMPAFGLSRHTRPVALVSGHPEKAQKVAAFYGIDPKAIYNYENYNTIKDNPAIEAVYIILPNHMHAEYTIRAHKAGKHVLCEKPMAASSAEAQQMIAAAKQANKQLMIAYRLRYEPFNRTAIEILRGGTLGKIRVIEAQNMQDVKPPNIRLSTKTAGGPLGDVGIYCLNAARYLTGEEPAEVSGMLHQPSDDERFREVPENVMFTLRFPSGALAMCTSGFGSHQSRRFRVNCAKGFLDMENAFGYYGQELRVMQEKLAARHDIRPANHFAAELDHLGECILNNKPVLTPGEEGLRDMVIMEKINEAMKTGNRVAIA